MKNSIKAAVSGSDAGVGPEQYLPGHLREVQELGKLRFKSTPLALPRVRLEAEKPSGFATSTTHSENEEGTPDSDRYLAKAALDASSP